MSPKQTRRAHACALLFLCLCCAASPAAQQPATPPTQQQQLCQQPAISAATRARSIFSPRQETELGDVIAERV